MPKQEKKKKSCIFSLQDGAEKVSDWATVAKKCNLNTVRFSQRGGCWRSFDLCFEDTCM